jgi:hypothetical protein
MAGVLGKRGVGACGLAILPEGRPARIASLEQGISTSIGNAKPAQQGDALVMLFGSFFEQRQVAVSA